MEVQQLRPSNVSYLQARDPSILAWNIHGLNKVKKNLSFEDETVSEFGKDDNSMKIYLRIKSGVPFDNLYEINEDTLICKIPDGSHIMRNYKDGECMTKKFTFSKIFEPNISQNDIFDCIVKSKMLSFINGNNSTLMTYGASGAGKTFTIIGNAEDPGIIPRALEYLFRTVPRLSEGSSLKPTPSGSAIVLRESQREQERQKLYNLLHCSSSMVDRQTQIKTYRDMQKRLSTQPVASTNDTSKILLGVWVSFAEIYNENLYDLLQPPPPRGKQRPILRLGKINDVTYIKNLNSINVSSGIEAYQILQYGLHNLNYAATALNSNSSRSHSIFTVKLVQAGDTGEACVSYFNFCDLAGSERTKKTMNVGDRLKESNNINTSLLVLGRCISSVRHCQKTNEKNLVPYRESKLTQLFQKALAGQEDICMIVNINPTQHMFDESHHVLAFSAVAKEIVVKRPQIKKIKPNNRFSNYMQNRVTSAPVLTTHAEENEESVEELKQTIDNLYQELELQKLEYENNERMAKERLVERYNELIEDIKKTHEEHIEDLKYEWKMRMRREIESVKENMEMNVQRQKVICLDSDDESENEKIAEFKEKLDKMQETVTKLKFENQMLKESEEALKQSVESLKNETKELKMTLNDAEVEFKDLEEKREIETTKMRSEIINLQEKIAEQEEYISTLVMKNCSEHSEETKPDDLKESEQDGLGECQQHDVGET